MSQLLDLLVEKDGFDKTDAFKRYFRQKAWKKGVPLFGNFELTPRCTLDCKMCYVHLNPGQKHQEELKTEQWISLMDQACDAGMMYATLTGGECLLYPGFREIYKHLLSRGILISILTNGTLLDEETVSWLSEIVPQRIQISVYGSSSAGYETVTGNADAFYKVNRAIDLVKKAGIPFNLSITVSKYMAGDFEAMYRYCKSKKPLLLSLSTMPFQARKETDREYSDYAPSLDEQVEVYKTRLKVDRNAIPFQCAEDATKETVAYGNQDGPKQKGISCSAGRASFSIRWDGCMLACNAFDFVKAYPLKEGFLPAWQYINGRSSDYEMPVECFDCKYRNACIRCPAVHWLGVGEGHCNPDVCAEGRRMVLEGFREL